MSDDKIRRMPGLPPEMTTEQKRNMLQQCRSDIPWMLEFAQFQAEVAFKKYKILVAQGFTEQQAIELLKGTI